MNQMLKFFEENTKRERKQKLERFKHLNTFAKKGQIVFAGSSLAEQFPIHELLLTIDKDVTLYNRGIGGDTIDNLLETMDTCIFDLEPSKIFINIGTNDMGNPDYSEATLMEKYGVILSRILERLPHTHIFILSYYPVNTNIPSFLPPEAKERLFSKRTNESILSANEQLQRLAKTYPSTYLDVSTLLMDEHNQLDAQFTIEGIHLWPNAYKKVFERLVDFF